MKASKWRLVIGVPIFIYGFFLIWVAIFNLWRDLDILIFGMLFSYSSFLFLAPLKNLKTFPENWNARYSFFISLIIYVIFFVPAILWLTKTVKSPFFNELVFSSYENGYTLSFLLILLAFGFNANYERGIHKRYFFIPLIVSVAIIILFVIIMILSVMSGIASA